MSLFYIQNSWLGYFRPLKSIIDGSLWTKLYTQVFNFLLKVIHRFTFDKFVMIKNRTAIAHTCVYNIPATHALLYIATLTAMVATTKTSNEKIFKYVFSNRIWSLKIVLCAKVPLYATTTTTTKTLEILIFVSIAMNKHAIIVKFHIGVIFLIVCVEIEFILYTVHLDYCPECMIY